MFEIDAEISATLTNLNGAFVCLVCGLTSGIKDPEAHCPVCNLPWEKLEAIR